MDANLVSRVTRRGWQLRSGWQYCLTLRKRGAFSVCRALAVCGALVAGCADPSQAPVREPVAAAPDSQPVDPSSSAPSSPAAPLPTASSAAPATPAQQPTAGSTREPKVSSESVTYDVGGKKFVSYLAYDSGLTTRRPGILVVPEWWGQNEYVRMRARQLAAAGYVAIAVDMYGDGKVTTDPAEAEKWSSAVYADLEQAQARFVAAKNKLVAHPYTAPDDISALGYCFGGGISLGMARRGIDLDGVASFHGNLATKKPAKPGVVKAKVLVLTGDADPMVPASQVEAFKKEMAAARVNTQIISYAGATHAFTNPEATEMGQKLKLPIAYDADADAKSWAELMKFLSGLYPNE